MSDSANLGLREQLGPDVSSWLLHDRYRCLASASVCSVPRMQRKLRGGCFHNEQALGFFFDPHGLVLGKRRK